MKIKGAIFDLDGTVLDSLHIWPQIDEDFLGRRGIAVPDDYVKEISTMGFNEIAVYTKERFNLSESVEEIKREWNEMSIMAYSNTIGLKNGAKEYLKFLKDKGIRLSVATASSDEVFVPALLNNEIYDLFDEFTTLAEVKRGKGYADIYLKAAEKIGLNPSECAVFEDIYEGLKAAKGAGFITVGIYEKYSVHPEEMIKEQSDLYIRDFEEMLRNKDFH